jgi:murein DD-endopeptidase MepM/ murein hydrolase activator NlpD
MILRMRRPAPDRRGWTAPRRSVISRTGILALVFVALAGGAFVSATPTPVSADALSDAYAKQKALQQLIAREKAQIAALNASQGDLSGKISNTKATLSSVIDNLTAVKTNIVQMTIEVAQSQANVDELATEVARLDQQLADVEADEAAKQAQLDATKVILADRIRTAYDTDRTSLLETVLSSNDFTDVISEVGYQMDFAGQDKALAEQIAADQKVLTVIHQTVVDTRTQTDALHTLAAQQQATLDGQLSDLAAEKAQLQALESEQQALLASQQAQYASLAANKAKLQATLAQQAKAQREIEALIRKLVQEQLAKGGIPSQYSGSLIWPMSGVITQAFGCTGFYLEPPYGSCAHFHDGIDIANQLGTPIRAAGPGKVIWAGKSPYDSAWIVVIAHSTHLVTWYAHVLSSPGPTVRAGQYVAQGQIIAYEGCTGLCSGPHLHWAVQLDNVWVNPRLFV